MPYDKFIICHQDVAIAKTSNYENNPHALKMCAEIFERMMHKLLVMKTGLQSEKIGINRWSDNIIPPGSFPFLRQVLQDLLHELLSKERIEIGIETLGRGKTRILYYEGTQAAQEVQDLLSMIDECPEDHVIIHYGI